MDEEIDNLLINWKVCWRCRLRLTTKEIDFELFRIDRPTETSICFICSGILQQQFLNDQIIDKIKFEIIDSKYQFESFQLVVSTPINLFIREFAVFSELNDKFPGKFSSIDELIPIKSVWRFLMKDQLANCLNKVYFNGNQAEVARSSGDCRLESDFLVINSLFEHDNCELECDILCRFDPALFDRRRKRESRLKWAIYTRKSVDKVLRSVTKETFRRHFGRIADRIERENGESTMKIEIGRRDSVLVAGRYVKLSRRLPQSPWIFDGVRKLDSSVEELISEKLVDAFRASSSGFLSSGREDVDVRMLKDGRPFVVELKDCRNSVRDLVNQMNRLEREINDNKDASGEQRILVKNLGIISREYLPQIKQGEETKSKRYRMVVWCENAISEDERELVEINATRDLLVQQLTPIRVLHRRALIDRPRLFHSFSAMRLDRAISVDAIREDNSLEDYCRFLDKYDRNHLFLLNLRCQAGSYVKEFVHGDLGRTQPNLATIMKHQCDILALDVMEIELEWPPKTQLRE